MLFPVQVYHKPPETFVSRTRLAVAKAEDLQAERAAEEGDESTGAPSTSGEVRAGRALTGGTRKR